MKRLLRTLLLLAVCCGSPALLRAADWVFIAHPSTASTAAKKEDIKNILLGTKTKWDGGGLIKLAVLSEGAVHDGVIQEFTAKSADQFDKYWKKQVFTGKGVAPEAFKTDAEMLAFVAKTPGAFGYVSAGAANDTVKSLSVE